MFLVSHLLVGPSWRCMFFMILVHFSTHFDWNLCSHSYDYHKYVLVLLWKGYLFSWKSKYVVYQNMIEMCFSTVFVFLSTKFVFSFQSFCVNCVCLHIGSWLCLKYLFIPSRIQVCILLCFGYPFLKVVVGCVPHLSVLGWVVLFNLVALRLSGLYSLNVLQECHLFLPSKEQELILDLHLQWLLLRLKLHLQRDLWMVVTKLLSFLEAQLRKRVKVVLALIFCCPHTCNLIGCASPLLRWLNYFVIALCCVFSCL